MEGNLDALDGSALLTFGEWLSGSSTNLIPPQSWKISVYLLATDWSNWLEIAEGNTAFA